MTDPIANRAHIAAEISRLERRQNGGIPATTARDWVVELVLAAERQSFTAADISAACANVEPYVRDVSRALRDRGRVQFQDLIDLATVARDRRRQAEQYNARQITASARRTPSEDEEAEALRIQLRKEATRAVMCMWMLPDEINWRRQEGEPLHTWDMRVQKLARRADEIWEALVDMPLDELRQVASAFRAKVVAMHGHEGLLSAVGRVGEMR